MSYSDYERALRSGKKKVILVRAGWVLRRKSLTCVKARIVGQRFNDGTRPSEYYNPNPKAMAHRVVMGRALQKGWRLAVGDVTAAFLQARLDENEEVYDIPPKSELQPGEKILWRIN